MLVRGTGRRTKERGSVCVCVFACSRECVHAQQLCALVPAANDGLTTEGGGCVGCENRCVQQGTAAAAAAMHAHKVGALTCVRTTVVCAQPPRLHTRSAHATPCSRQRSGLSQTAPARAHAAAACPRKISNSTRARGYSRRVCGDSPPTPRVRARAQHFTTSLPHAMASAVARTLRLACAQLRVGADKVANAHVAVAAIEEAAAGGAGMVVLPECW
ncbi:hypothetical protein EON67_10470, partial [archaeon]